MVGSITIQQCYLPALPPSSHFLQAAPPPRGHPFSITLPPPRLQVLLTIRYRVTIEVPSLPPRSEDEPPAPPGLPDFLMARYMLVMRRCEDKTESMPRALAMVDEGMAQPLPLALPSAPSFVELGPNRWEFLMTQADLVGFRMAVDNWPWPNNPESASIRLLLIPAAPLQAFDPAALDLDAPMLESAPCPVAAIISQPPAQEVAFLTHSPVAHLVRFLAQEIPGLLAWPFYRWTLLCQVHDFPGGTSGVGSLPSVSTTSDLPGLWQGYLTMRLCELAWPPSFSPSRLVSSTFWRGFCNVSAVVVLMSPLRSMLMVATQRALAVQGTQLSEFERLVLVWHKFNGVLLELPWRSSSFARPMIVTEPAITMMAALGHTWLYTQVVNVLGHAIDAETPRQKLFVSLIAQALVATAFYPFFTLGRRALFSSVPTSPAVLVPAAGWTALYAGLGADLLRRSVFMTAKWVVLETFKLF